MNQRVAPNLQNTSSVTVSPGRTFSTGSGVVDLQTNDSAIIVLGANGWVILPPHGTTAQRPTTAAPGGHFFDDTLGKTLFAVVWPVGSGNVVAWVDGAGNSA